MKIRKLLFRNILKVTIENCVEYFEFLDYLRELEFFRQNKIEVSQSVSLQNFYIQIK